MFEFERKKNLFGLDCEDDCTIFNRKNRLEFDLPSLQPVIPEFKQEYIAHQTMMTAPEVMSFNYTIYNSPYDRQTTEKILYEKDTYYLAAGMAAGLIPTL